MNKFINKLLLLVLSMGLFFESSYTMHNKPQSLGYRYLNFLNNVGSLNEKKSFQDTEFLFSPNCCKVVNGKLISTNIIELETQLRGAQETFKCWTVKPYDENCILFPENNIYVLEFEVGNAEINLIVIKYLTFDENGLITNINEVYNIKKNHAFLARLRENKPSTETDSAALKRAGERYIEFLQHFGKPGDQETLWEMAQIISSTCLKLINGGIVSRGRTSVALFEPGLCEQLSSAKETFGSWEIEIDQEGVIADSQHNVCMVRYGITPSKSEATYAVIDYLRFDQDGNIEEINEVYNQKDS